MSELQAASKLGKSRVKSKSQQKAKTTDLSKQKVLTNFPNILSDKNTFFASFWHRSTLKTFTVNGDMRSRWLWKSWFACFFNLLCKFVIFVSFFSFPSISEKKSVSCLTLPWPPPTKRWFNILKWTILLLGAGFKDYFMDLDLYMTHKVYSFRASSKTLEKIGLRWSAKTLISRNMEKAEESEKHKKWRGNVIIHASQQ